MEFKSGTAIVCQVDYYSPKIEKGRIVYYLTDIPNIQGHCIVITRDGVIVPMVHPEDFRKATEEEV